jgi:hypothetical protein
MALSYKYHDLETAGSVHVPHDLEYADQATRKAAAGLETRHIGRLGKQLDDLSTWMLKDNSPLAWIPFTAPEPVVGDINKCQTILSDGDSGVKLGWVSQTLDQCYDNTGGSGTRTIDVNSGSVLWDLSATNEFRIDVKDIVPGEVNNYGFKYLDTSHYFYVSKDKNGSFIDAQLNKITMDTAGTTVLTGIGNLTLTYSNLSLSTATLTVKGSSPQISTDASENLILLPGAGGITVIGDAGSTSHSLTANDDLFVSGQFEADGNSFFDGAVTVSNNLVITDNNRLYFGTSSDASLRWNTTGDDHLVLGLGATSKYLVIADGLGGTYGHTNQSNATIFLHSANSGNPNEWLSLTHNQTDGVIQTGTGNIQLLPATGNITQIGDAGSPGHLGTPTNDDAFISGRLEVDGKIYADSGLAIDGSSTINDDKSLFFGDSNDAKLIYRTTQTPDTLMFAVSTQSNHLVICQNGDTSFDFAHALQTNPTLFIQSANQSTTEWGSLAHNQTDFIINQGAGTTKLAGGVTHNVTTVNAATYDLLISDYLVHVTYTATAAVTSLTLPTAQTLAGRFIIIKDAGGSAGTNNITIDTEGGENIDGSATNVISTNYASRQLYSDGSNWFVV